MCSVLVQCFQDGTRENVGGDGPYWISSVALIPLRSVNHVL
jgi:hypothetical protein